MLSSKRISILKWLIFVVILVIPASNGYSLDKTDQIAVEAKSIEIIQITPNFYVFELKVLGPETTKVDAVILNIDTGWAPDARIATMPKGWRRLDTKKKGVLRLEGDEVSLPLKIELVSRSKTPEVISLAKLKISKRKFKEIKNIPVRRIELPVMVTKEVTRKITELKINVRKANIRSKPGLKGRIITSASEGEIIKSDKKLENWFRVPLPYDSQGKEKFGYIHKKIVSVMEKSEEVTDEIPEEITKPVKQELIQIVKEPLKVKTDSLLKRLLKRTSVKISGGPGFFMNGMGDLEKLRTETRDFLTAIGKSRVTPDKLNFQRGDPNETEPSYQTSFDWDPLRLNTHFQVGLNFDINKKFSVGVSVGTFGANNNNIEYSHSWESVDENEWWSWNETDETTYTESYDLSAVPVFATVNYSSNPRYSSGKFTPEFSFGIGPIFANMKRNHTEEFDYNRVVSSTHYQNTSDHIQMSRSMTGNYNATALGIQLSGGIDYSVNPMLTIGIDGFFNFASFGNWSGSEEGNWESRIQRSNDARGGVYQDETDSGSWSFGPDLPLYYYYNPFNGIDQPFMFVGENPPVNGISPSINWNTWGIQLTFKISLGGKPEPANVPENEINDSPGPGDDPGTNPTDTDPPVIYGEDLEKEDNIWNAYVYIGNLSGAEFNRTAIVGAADEAQSDFKKAGYNVIPEYYAKIKDFKTIVNDPQAKAFWFAGHGSKLMGKPFAQIQDVGKNGISPTVTLKIYKYNTDYLFKKPGLNQVTIHACYQDLPEWYVAFSDAKYISWTIEIKGFYIYLWQLLHVYPEIDQSTGEEIEFNSWLNEPIFKKEKKK